MSENPTRLLADRIYERLKAEIITCKYKPGASLTEIGLANKFNVSRTPIREVCNQLLKEDLLQSIPYKGYIISPLNLQYLHELYQIRAILEPHAAESAARNPSPRFLEALRANLEEADSFSAEQDFVRFVEIDLDFHHPIAEGCGNRRLAKMLGTSGINSSGTSMSFLSTTARIATWLSTNTIRSSRLWRHATAHAPDRSWPTTSIATRRALLARASERPA